MESQTVSCAGRQRTDQWQSLVGKIVQVRLDGELYREGLVDAAMPDASGLWVAAEGASQRQFIDNTSGYEVWTSLYPRSSCDVAMASEVAAKAAEVANSCDSARNDGRTRAGSTQPNPAHPLFVIQTDEVHMN